MHFKPRPNSPPPIQLSQNVSVLYVLYSAQFYAIIPSSMLCQHDIFHLLPNFFWPQTLDSKFPDPYLCKTGGFVASLPISKLHAIPRLTCCLISIAAFLYPAPPCISLAAGARISPSERFSAHFSDILRQVFNISKYYKAFCLKK